MISTVISVSQLEVQAPPGNTVGYVVQQWHPISPKFIVYDENREPILKIHGPFCGWSCLPDVDFEVKGLSENKHQEQPNKFVKAEFDAGSSAPGLPPRAAFLKILVPFALRRETGNVFPIKEGRGVDDVEKKPPTGAHGMVVQCDHCSVVELVLLGLSCDGDVGQ